MKLDTSRSVTELTREELLAIAAQGLEQIVPQVISQNGYERLGPPVPANDPSEEPERQV